MRSALAKVDGITGLKTDVAARSASFEAPADMDVEAILNKFADEGNEHIAGWSKADDKAAPAKDTDGAATSKKANTQTVSLKLPGMT